MAVTTKFVVFVVLCCLVVMQQASECNLGHGCFYAKAATQRVGNRKVLYKGVVVNGPITSGSGGNLVGWELRSAPTGPDPLHHNGAGPKKPRTP